MLENPDVRLKPIEAQPTIQSLVAAEARLVSLRDRLWETHLKPVAIAKGITGQGYAPVLDQLARIPAMVKYAHNCKLLVVYLEKNGTGMQQLKANPWWLNDPKSGWANFAREVIRYANDFPDIA